MAEFQTPEPVVMQWRRRLEEAQEDEASVSAEISYTPQLAQSDPGYYPSTSPSPEGKSLIRATRPRRILQRPAKPPLPGEQAHEATPEDRREESGKVVNVNNRALSLKRRNSEDPTRT